MTYMTRLLRFTAIAVLSACACTGAFGQQPSLVGAWEWTRKKDGCAEQFVFLENGTATIRRGEKRTENTYLMAWAPERSGRYGLTLTTVKDHGGRDCQGSVDEEIGRSRVVYLLFSQSGESMIMCESPAGTDCTGLIRRVTR